MALEHRIGVDRGDDLGVRRLRHEVDERQPPGVGQRRVELAAADVALRERGVTQPDPLALVAVEGVGETLARDRPLGEQRLPEPSRLAHVRPRRS